MNVTPGIAWTSSTPLTAANLNLAAQPTVSAGTNELTLSNFPTASANNTWIARYTTGSGNYEALVTTTTGLGFFTGAGGTVTQATSKATGVTLSKQTGLITLDAASLAGDPTVSFTLTNTLIASTDLLILNHVSGGTAGSYLLNAQCASGSASINVRNITTGALAEAIVIRFAVFKSVNT
jgi:hypothetical protein